MLDKAGITVKHEESTLLPGARSSPVGWTDWSVILLSLLPLRAQVCASTLTLFYMNFEDLHGQHFAY